MKGLKNCELTKKRTQKKRKQKIQIEMRNDNEDESIY